MEKQLIDQNKHWSGEEYDNFIPRKVLPGLIKMLSLHEILVLKGVRRCGKTTLFHALINHLAKTTSAKSILYINLDDPYFTAVNEDAKNLYLIIETAEKITGTKVEYVFFDEIQNVLSWEKFVKSVYDSKLFKKIFITGSNAQLLESDYATLLSGRYVDQSVFPLSFKECLEHKDIRDTMTLIQDKPMALSIFENMLHFGGFPRSYLEPDESLKRKILAGYYDTILLKDCIAVANVRDARLMMQLAHYMVSNVAARFSYNKIAVALESNENTIKEYIHIMTKGYLFDEVMNFSFSQKKQARGNKKAYCVDNGIISAVAFQFQLIHGKLFENLVYSELLKKSASEIYMINEGKECDFIVKHHGECIALQVCYSLTPQSRQREIDGARLGMNHSRARKGYIITYDQDEKIEDDLVAIPFWKCFGVIDDISELF
jgi:predicted AAA+ superfamily ATPase